MMIDGKRLEGTADLPPDLALQRCRPLCILCVEHFFGPSRRHGTCVASSGGSEQSFDVAAVTGVREAADDFGKSSSGDQNEWVSVIDDLDLRLAAEDACCHIDTDPTALKSGHHPGNLIGADPRIGIDALRLAEHDHRGTAG